VVELKPTFEVHPAGHDVVVIAEQDMPVVGLKPTLEVHPAGKLIELAQD
jgi:hypothetical protein